MQIYLLRHGQTEYNAQHRYQGQQDIPLSAAGRAQLRPAGFMPDVVYVSPLIRARQTAEIFFPGCPQIIVQDLREMCFGSFEGRNYVEMEHDPDYLAWVAANCESQCPDGERKTEFSDRICRTFAALVDKALADVDKARANVNDLQNSSDISQTSIRKAREQKAAARKMVRDHVMVRSNGKSGSMH